MYMYYDKLECGKYYEVITRNKDYRHLNLVNYNGIDFFLHFIDDEGNNIFLDYYDILDICESEEKEEKYSEDLYFKDKILHVKVKKYCVKQRIQKNFYKVYNNCIIDSIEWIEKVPHLRIITQNDRAKCINMLFIEDIDDAE